MSFENEKFRLKEGDDQDMKKIDKMNYDTRKITQELQSQNKFLNIEIKETSNDIKQTHIQLKD